MRKTVVFLLVLMQTGIACALAVRLKADVDGGARPTVVGSTNLPDGTELLIELARKESSYTAQATTRVASGAFRAGPFSQRGAALNPGVYTLQVVMPVAAVQQPSIWPVIGNEGSKLSGALVRRSKFGGNVVEYRSRFKVGSGAAAPTVDNTARKQAQADRHAWWLQSCKDTCTMTQSLAGKRNEAFNFDRCYYKCVADEPSTK